MKVKQRTESEKKGLKAVKRLKILNLVDYLVQWSFQKNKAKSLRKFNVKN